MADFNAADPLGADLSCWPGMDPSGAYVSGNVALCQALARRLTTPRGGLWYAPNYGTDVRAWLNEAITPDILSRLKRAVEGECAADERVQTVNADVTGNSQQQSLTIHITGTTQAGPFIFVLAFTSVTVTLLKAG